MSTFSISVSIRGRNLDQLAKLQARLADFSAPLTNIIREWAAGNRRKFAMARGAETTGADVDRYIGLRWERLKSDSYRRAKRRKGFRDWLMVATGSLVQSLTTSGAFGEYVDAKRAIFGTPLDFEDADKALYNRETRPVIFLGYSDRNMIKREVQRYLGFGDGYREVFADASAKRYALEQEEAQSRIDIGQALGVHDWEVGPA